MPARTGQARSTFARVARVLALLALGGLALASSGEEAAAASPIAAKPAAKPTHKKAAPPKSKTSRDKARKKKSTAVAQVTPRLPPLPPPLDGNTYDFDYDGKDIGHPERGWLGRSFLHSKIVGDPARPLPILVFLHGMNTEQIKYRWMGGGQEGDVRRIVSALIESEQIPPMIVAGPSTIDAVTASNAILLWPGFDLDTFLDKTQERLQGLATIDRSRVIVAGHSGAGCNTKGGLNTALKSKITPFAGLVIDTCLLVDEAVNLVHLRPATHVVVSWQSISWEDRFFDDFRNAFKRELKKVPAPAGILRELDYQQPSVASPHDAMVGITLRKWLPRLVPGPAAPGSPATAKAVANSSPGG